MQTPPPILIVEDETLIRMSIALEFEMAGISALDVASADEALELLEAGKLVSAVVTDIRMPGKMDGWGLIQWMGKHMPHTPVIVTSGYPLDPKNDVPPVTAVLSKPYDIAKIITLLRSLHGPESGAPDS